MSEGQPAGSAATVEAERVAELGDSFFARSVHDVARDLIGCTIVHDGVGGIIVETESYHADDPACHAFCGPTERNRIMFGPPAHAYVYRSYGVHNLLNIVAEPDGCAAAVLIRAVEPSCGVGEMCERRSTEDLLSLCSGPGKLTQAMAIDLTHNGAPIGRRDLRIRPRAALWVDPEIATGPRVGISKGVDLPWRFCAAGSPFLSKPRLPSLRQ